MKALGRGEGIGARFGTGTAAGLLAGALVGLIEAGIVVAGRSELPERQVFLYATLTYGLASGVLGAALGALGGPLASALGRPFDRARSFALLFALVAGIETVIIGRFRLLRDLFHEQHPGAWFDAALAAGFLLLLLLLRYAVMGPLARRRILSWVTRPGGALTGYAALVLLATGFSALGRGRAEGAAPPPARRGVAASGMPNVILIIIDTLRADRLSCYGYPERTSPNIDVLASRSILFRRASAQASWTRPAIATIMTSLYPSSHQAVRKPDLLPDDVVTLAEALQEAGYHTVGFADNVNIAPAFNFHQGFDEYTFLEPAFFFGARESSSNLTLYNQMRLVQERFFARRIHVQNYYQDAEEVNRHVLAWLATPPPQPFFLFVHYMDPHDPYFAHPYDGIGVARVGLPNPPPARREELGRLYDGEIRFVDAAIGELLRHLEAEGLLEGSLVVLTADHGEEFFDHRGWWHGTTLYQEQIDTPLLVRLPGGAHAGEQDTTLARHIDIAPSILATLGLTPPVTWQGLALIHPGGDGGSPYVFAEEDHEGNVLGAIRERGWKLIIANPGNPRGLPPLQLFDLASDPGEQADLASARPDLVQALQARLGEAELLARAQAVGPQEGAMDAATRERLRALGYIK